MTVLEWLALVVFTTSFTVVSFHVWDAVWPLWPKRDRSD